MIRKTKTMAQILAKFPDAYFMKDGRLRLCASGRIDVYAHSFHLLGKEIDTGGYAEDTWQEELLEPLPKKKTIKLFRYFYQHPSGTFECTPWTSRPSSYFENISCAKILKTEEKEIEVNDE